jgi:hypothetical protein
MDEFLQLQRGAQPAYCLIKFHAVAYLRTGGRKVPQTETVHSDSELIKVPLWQFLAPERKFRLRQSQLRVPLVKN